MRIGLMLDSFYLLASLGGATSSQVCASRPEATFSSALETGRSQLARPATAAAVTAFIKVNVVPMDTERVLSNQTVLVEDGRITAMGPASQIKVPAGAVLIDGQGKYLIPGLANMHGHKSSQGPTTVDPRAEPRYDLSAILADGITTVRYIEGNSDITPQQLRTYFTTAETPIPHMYIGSRLGSIPLDSIAAKVATTKAAGYHHIGIGYLTGQIDPAGKGRAFFDSLVVLARGVGLPIVSHADPGVPMDALQALGATGGSFEHLYTFVDALGYPSLYPSKHRTSSDVAMPEVAMPALQALAAATQRTGVWVTPTLSCTEYKYSPHPTYTKLLRQIVKALQDAGVGLLLSKDDGFEMHHELTALVRAGLTPYQALVTGTRNVAAFYKLLDSTGTVAVGKRADLVLLSGNPLQDIRHVREPAGVMIEGRWLDRATLDRHLLASQMSFNKTLRKRGIVDGLTGAQAEEWQQHVATFMTLTGSLEVTKPKIIDEIVAMRAMLARPEARDMFDMTMRVWLRAHAPQLIVPGVTSAP